VRRRRPEVARADDRRAGQELVAGGIELLVGAGRAHPDGGLGEVERDLLRRAEAEGVATGEGVDRELEALVDTLLAREPARLVVEDLDAAGWQAVDAVDRSDDDDDRSPVGGLEPELEPELLVERLAGAGELAGPEVVEERRL